MWDLSSLAQAVKRLTGLPRNLAPADEGLLRQVASAPAQRSHHAVRRLCEVEFRLWKNGKIISDLYRVKKPLGQGGFGVVFLAEELATRQPVAIKVPVAVRRCDVNGREVYLRFADDPTAKKALLSEVRAWMQLAHPHVVEVRDLRDDDSTDYLPAICLEFCNGGSLAGWLRRYPQGAPLDQGLDFAIQVCWALECIHNCGIVHRDIKAANVLLTSEPHAAAPKVLVTDLGLAKVLCGGELQGTAPGAGQVVSWRQKSIVGGTPTHMPPEQWEIGGAVGPHSDVYAFGVLLYEIFCGRVPFRPHILLDLRRQHCHAKRPDPRTWRPKLPPELALLMLRCIDPQPELRPPVPELEDRLRWIFFKVTGEEHENYRPKPSAAQISETACRRRAWARVRLGIGATRRGDYAEAKREFAAAARLCQQIRDEAGLAACCGNWAILLGIAGKLQAALQVLKKAERIYRDLGDFQSLACALTNQAHVLDNLRRWEEAITLVQEAQHWFDKASDINNLAMSWILLASLYLSQGNLAETQRALDRGSELACRVEDRHLRARIYLEQATLMMKADRLGEALELLRQAEYLCRQAGDNSLLIGCLGTAGVVLRRMGLFEEALRHLEEQAKLAEDLCDTTALARSLITQAAVLIDLARFPEALARLTRAEELARQGRFKSELVGCLINYALCLFLHPGDRVGALRKLDEAAEICREAHLYDLLHNVNCCRQLINESSS